MRQSVNCIRIITFFLNRASVGSDNIKQQATIHFGWVWIQLPENYKQNFDVPSEGPSSRSSSTKGLRLYL